SASRNRSCSPSSARPGRPRSPSACSWSSSACVPRGCSVDERPMKFWLSAALALVLAVLAAFTIKNEYFFFAAYVVLQFVVLATAWNILGGYAGYVNFGTGAFFGVGAYTGVLLIKSLGLPLAVQILAAATVGGLLGFGAGLLTLRLRGIFFSIATVAVAIILETVVINWRYVGGATGIQILRPPVMEPF